MKGEIRLTHRWLDRRALAGAVILLISLCAAFALSRSMRASAPVLVFTADLAPGSVIQEDHLAVAQVVLPRQQLESVVGVDGIEAVAGKTVFAAVVAGDLVQHSSLTEPVEERFEVTIASPAGELSYTNLRAGDTVDVLATLEIELGLPRTFVAATGARVLSVPADAGDGSAWGEVGASVSLGLRAEEVLPVAYSMRVGSIDLVRVPRNGAGVSGSFGIEGFGVEAPGE